jgi:hypothetical protein
MPVQMKVGNPLQSRETSREPQAIIKSLGGSHTSNGLNIDSFSIAPVNNRMPSEARTEGSREVRHNIQRFQGL